MFTVNSAGAICAGKVLAVADSGREFKVSLEGGHTFVFRDSLKKNRATMLRSMAIEVGETLIAIGGMSPNGEILGWDLARPGEKTLSTKEVAFVSGTVMESYAGVDGAVTLIKTGTKQEFILSPKPAHKGDNVIYSCRIRTKEVCSDLQCLISGKGSCKTCTKKRARKDLMAYNAIGF